MELKAGRLAKTLEAALGASPAAAGRRLVSEPELAKLCGVSRQTLRGALELLISEGFIVRRHGSGTYVRKVSSLEALDGLPSPPFAPESIFLPAGTEDSAHEPLPSQRAMVLGVSNEFSGDNISNKMVMDGLRDRAEALGHSIRFLPALTFDDEASRPPKGYAKALREARCDGYIQMANSRLRFLNGLAEAFPSSSKPPVCYLWCGSWTRGDCHPLISLDTNEAIRLALSKLAANGRRRIAMLHLSHARWSWVRAEAESFYDWTAGGLGLSYRAVRTVADVASASRAEAAMDELWSDGSAPDGLFVADDHFLPYAVRWLAKRKLRPGLDLGVVVQSNKGQTLDGSRAWSQVRFTQEQAGRLAIDSLLRAIQSAGEDLCSFAQRPQWIQGDTH